MTKPDMQSWPAIRQRLILLESSIKAADSHVSELTGQIRQNTERARTAHARLDEREDEAALLMREVLERLTKIEARLDRQGAFLTILKDERKGTT